MTQEQSIAQRFQIPEIASGYQAVFLNKAERRMLLEYEPEEFGAAELGRWLAARFADGSSTEERAAAADPEHFIQRAFVRGVLVKSGDVYTFGNFYGRLDIFVTEEQEEYRRLPEKLRRAWDAWYMEKYLERLKHQAEEAPYSRERPTDDRVLTLEETLRMIDEREDAPYLALCDCRALLGDCGKPKETCLTYRTAENSFAAKGLARKLTKEEAKEVVRAADRAGLIHTANAGGICNCCTDCCYLFRAADRLGIRGTWPAADKRIHLDSQACIGCGRCAARCPFGVFELRTEEGGRRAAAAGLSACVGCGLCAGVCPAGALSLRARGGRKDQKKR